MGKSEKSMFPSWGKGGADQSLLRSISSRNLHFACPSLLFLLPQRRQLKYQALCITECTATPYPHCKMLSPEYRGTEQHRRLLCTILPTCPVSSKSLAGRLSSQFDRLTCHQSDLSLSSPKANCDFSSCLFTPPEQGPSCGSQDGLGIPCRRHTCILTMLRNHQAHGALPV